MLKLSRLSQSLLFASFMASTAVLGGCSGGSVTSTLVQAAASNPELLSTVVQQYQNLSPSLQNVIKEYVVNYAKNNALSSSNVLDVVSKMDGSSLSSLSGMLTGLSSDSTVLSTSTDKSSLISTALNAYNGLSSNGQSVANSYLSNYATAQGLASDSTISSLLPTMNTGSLQNVATLLSGLGSL